MYPKKSKKPKNYSSGKILHNNEDKSTATEDHNVLYIYKPINIINQLAGVHKIIYTNNHATTVGYISKIYSLLLCAFLITNCVLITRELYDRTTVAIVIVIDVLANISVCASTVISTLLAAFLISPFMLRALKSFQAVDKTLGIQGKDNYTYIRSRILIAQVIIIITSIADVIMEWIVKVNLWSDNLRAVTIHLMDFFQYCQILDFTAVIWIIVTRMKVFNSQLENLISNEKEKKKLQHIERFALSNKINYEIIDEHQRERLHDGQSIASDETRVESLVRLMKVFDELADITNIVSSSYGLSLLFICTTTFLYIVSTVNGLIMFKILLEEDANHTIPYIISWCVPATSYLLISAYTSERLRNEVERTNAALDKLSINTTHDTKECELIEDFSQLLSVREVFITAANFFRYDMTFVLSLVGAVATYTVLLMQVKTDKSTGGSTSNSTIVNLNTTTNHS